MPEVLCDSILAKIEEQIERTVHLSGLLPEDAGEFLPQPGGWKVSLLLGHLLECMAGVCAVLAAAEPQRLAHFTRLRDLPVNQACTAGETEQRAAVYRAHIREGFALLHDNDLARLLPTVFVPGGETVLTLLLGNLEHLINHKHQLFVCLRAMGRGVATADLYRLRS